MKPVIIVGNRHIDSRGVLSYNNEFNMAQIKRFYSIEHPDVNIVRAWRGHRIENRWFSVSKGSFIIKAVEIDDWASPSPSLPQLVFHLTADESTVLHVPKGYATSLQATEANSKIIIFADGDIADAKNDDHLFPNDYFIENNKQI